MISVTKIYVGFAPKIWQINTWYETHFPELQRSSPLLNARKCLFQAVQTESDEVRDLFYNFPFIECCADRKGGLVSDPHIKSVNKQSTE